MTKPRELILINTGMHDGNGHTEYLDFTEDQEAIRPRDEVIHVREVIVDEEWVIPALKIEVEYLSNKLDNAEKALEDAKETLKFYADMDNRVPGTAQWDQEIIDILGNKGTVHVTAYSQPSIIDKDMGQKAREVLKKIKSWEKL